MTLWRGIKIPLNQSQHGCDSIVGRDCYETDEKALHVCHFKRTSRHCDVVICTCVQSKWPNTNEAVLSPHIGKVLFVSDHIHRVTHPRKVKQGVASSVVSNVCTQSVEAYSKRPPLSNAYRRIPGWYLYPSYFWSTTTFAASESPVQHKLNSFAREWCLSIHPWACQHPPNSFRYSATRVLMTFDNGLNHSQSTSGWYSTYRFSQVEVYHSYSLLTWKTTYLWLYLVVLIVSIVKKYQ